MYSLNVPVPGAVARLAGELRPQLATFDRIRDRHTLVVKRFEETSLHRLRERLRPALTGAPAFEARTAGIDFFERPARGTGPVVYLAVDSPGLEQLHDRLTDRFDAIAGLEGPDYVPHVTLARGGPVADAERLASTDVDSVTWTVSRLDLYDSTHREAVTSIRLPA